MNIDKDLVAAMATPLVLAILIIPVGDGGAKSDPLNLQSLCASCHASKSKRENAERRAARA